jgi:hypothetical protein
LRDLHNSKECFLDAKLFIYITEKKYLKLSEQKFEEVIYALTQQKVMFFKTANAV